jgi:hypothetical protein
MGLVLARRVESEITMLFTVCALYSLNFSVGPHQTLSLFITTFLFTFYHPNTVKNVLRLPDHGWYLTFKSPECISLRRCLATNTSSLQETFGVLHSICHELGGLLLLWSSSNGIFSSQGGQDHKPLHLHCPSPWLMKFSQNPHHTLSLSTTTSHGYLLSEHCGLVSQDSLSCNCPLFSNLSIRSYLAANLCGHRKLLELYHCKAVDSVFCLHSVPHIPGLALSREAGSLTPRLFTVPATHA